MPVQVAAIGDVIAGRNPGRRAATDVVLFLCTGLGVQDASLAWAIIELAVARKLGTTVEF
jgi:alanine dehydrogenase